MQRESSLDADDLDQLEVQEQQDVQDALQDVGYEAEEDDEDADLPPGRIHATRSAAELRLKGTSKATMSLPNMALPPQNTGSTDSSVGSGGSGSASHSHGNRRPKSSSGFDLHHHKSPRGGTASTVPADGNSSISSLEDLGLDSDILYDRAGLQDELSASSAEAKTRSKSRENFVNLPPVNERLSEDTLEDVHAFSDAKVASASQGGGASSVGGGSRANSTVGEEGAPHEGQAGLDPLEECSQEDVSLMGLGSLEDPSETLYDDNEMPPVILTNIENLSLQAAAAHGDASQMTDGGLESNVSAQAQAQPQVASVPEQEPQTTGQEHDDA